MQIQVVQGDIALFSADTIITNLFDDVVTPSGATGALDQALDGAISELIANGDASGKEGEVRVIYPRGAIAAKRVLIVGLGKRTGFDLRGVRTAAAHGIRAARLHKAQHVATIVHGAGVAGLDAEAAAQATMEGSLLALHEFPANKQIDALHEIETLSVVEFDEGKMGAVGAGVDSAEKICAGVMLARDLVFNSPNIVNPAFMADTAAEIAAQFDLDITVGDRVWMREHKMGALLAVAQGAGFEPRFIVLEHNADRDDLPTICLVGKGITFDTGGVNLKTASGMLSMKSDMGGAAAVLGAMKAVAALNLPLHVVGITPCTENMPDAAAYRPSDVITASNGKTIEIINTDAEGRLALADALVYAQRYEPDTVIDLATLTGASVTAMGRGVAAALFSNEATLTKALVTSGQQCWERVWPFPLWREYRKTIDSPVADVKNSGGAGNGLGTSAVFLEEFTDYNWAHLDIAGVTLTNKANANAWEKQHGATGFGVRLLVNYLRTLSA